ncbi:cyclic nucleotide-binding domain-containing protein [Legionella genomosp. 1]|uniref:cyclic nucleotide-binding domain-containing protein n=1 Tax=Legionella genomosp. 1 TaxID=1093625 RepID=UPI001056652F|nr:cyclic nucleotide-binding domain-containing protein [Legionella genomosp. 1]
MDIVIVGGGASGIAAAFTLANENHNVTIIEELEHLGGHCFGVKVFDNQGQSWALDAGVTDFNQDQFHHFKEFIDFFKIPYHPINQSLSIIDERNNLVFANIDGTVFIRKDCPLDREIYLKEINRFRMESLEFLLSNPNSEISLGNYLKNQSYSKIFSEEYIYPRATACFQVPNSNPENYRLIPLLQFWQIHGIIGSTGKRMALNDGMFSYTEVFKDWFIKKNSNNRIMLNKRVLGIARHGHKISIRASSTSGENISLTFDHVIISINPYHAISLFEDAKKYEKNLLVNFPWQRATFTIHSDSSIMPKEKAHWGGYNCLYAPESSTILRPTITFYINKIKNLPAQIPDVFLTLNPFRQIAPDKIYQQKFYIHPSMIHSSQISRQYINEIQGENNTWYCGSYLIPPHVHESAFISGIEVANKLLQSVKSPSDLRNKSNYNSLYFSDFIEKLTVFSGLDPIIFHDIGLISTIESFPANTCIFKQYTPADGMYIIITGEVTITAQSSMKVVATLGAGELFGELGILANIPRTASAIAKTDSQVFFIQKNILDAIFNHSNYSAFIFTQRIINYVARHIEQTCCKLNFTPIINKESRRRQTFDELSSRQKARVASFDIFSYLPELNKQDYLKKVSFYYYDKNSDIPITITNQFLLIMIEGEAQILVDKDNQKTSIIKISSGEIINPWVVSDIHINCFKIIPTKKTFFAALSPECLDYSKFTELVISVYKRIKIKLAEIQNRINEL